MMELAQKFEILGVGTRWPVGMTKVLRILRCFIGHSGAHFQRLFFLCVMRRFISRFRLFLPVVSNSNGSSDGATGG